MKISRRGFLWGGAAAVAGASLPWFDQIAHTQGREGKNLIVVFAQGGWDATAHLDPKLGLDTVDSAPGDLKVYRDLSVLTHTDRPAVLDFYRSYAEMSCIARGIEVRSIAHEECTKRIFTGTNNAANPDLGAVVGNRRGSDRAVPYMVLGNTAYPGPFAGTTGRTGISGQLVTLLDPDNAYPDARGRRRKPFVPTEPERDLIESFIADRGARDMAARGHGKSGARLRDYLEARPRAIELEKLAAGFGERTFQLELDSQMDLAVRFLKEGMSKAVLVEDDAEWDTHNDNHEQQARNLQHLYAALHGLGDKLDAEGLLENTLVVVLSEMSRTPKLNENRGKDHWPVTSALLFGAGVKGGAAVGATNELAESVPVDMATGKPDEDGKTVSSANFVAGVLSAMEIDPEPLLPGIEPLGGMFS
jgi:hypothetical protein